MSMLDDLLHDTGDQPAVPATTTAELAERAKYGAHTTCSLSVLLWGS